MNIDPNATKYMIKAKITADGIVEKPDVVGAIFGQTEGLLGDDLDLRDLQKSGRIGRIEVEIVSKGGKSEGIIYMASSLDQVETVILASALETIDRVGPCKASIRVLGIEDVRVTKREKVVERAKELLNDLIVQSKGTSSDLTQSIRQSIQVEEITTYGKDRCPAGPAVKDSESIIIVEGRSDVLNLLRAGIKNAIAVEGTNIPKTVQDLSREKVATAFTDGDRGGELILRELFQTSEIDFVARAPRAHEVEELTSKQIVKCLRNKVPGDQYMEMNGLSYEEKNLDETAERDLREGERREIREDDKPRRDREAREGRDRRDRPERSERSERPVERSERTERTDRTERTERPERSERSERPERSNDRTERPERSERSERPVERSERTERTDRTERTERPERSERSERPVERRKDNTRTRDSDSDSDERRERKERFNSENADRYKKKNVHGTENSEERVDAVDNSENESKIVERREESAVIESVPKSENVEASDIVSTEYSDELKKTRKVREKAADKPERAHKEDDKSTRTLRAKKDRNTKTLSPEQEVFRDMLLDMSSTHNAKILAADNSVIREVAVKGLVSSLKEESAGTSTIIFDGVISQRILDVSAEKGINTVVGTRKGNITKMPANIVIWTKEDLY